MVHSKDSDILVHEESLSLLNEKAFTDSDSDSELGVPRQRWSSSLAGRFTNHVRDFRPTITRGLFVRLLIALLPSWLQPRSSSTRSRAERSHQTAYLDGIRGLAALFVFFCHYSYTCYVITTGYGHGTNENILQLPIIRLFYQGPPMVCLFFVISGYALSLKPLKQMRSRSWEAMFTTVSSSIFRRAIRLFLPCFASTFLVVIMLRLGFYEGTRTFATQKGYLRNVLEHHPAQLPTFASQIADWAGHMFNFIHIWNWEPYGGSTSYDVHLWTIPLEFRASMMLFLTLIGLSRLRTWLRFVALAGITWFTYRSNQWGMVLFFAGMVLAEIDLISQQKASRSSSSQPFQSVRDISRGMAVLWTFMAVFALYLMSQPDEGFESTPGWVWLSSIVPTWFTEKYRYWQCVGAVLFLTAVGRVKCLQRPFNLAGIQYLGKISYALYLMHGPVMHTIGYTIMKWSWELTGATTAAGYHGGFLLGALINIPIVIWAADVFWRLIDTPSVTFARWLEHRCIAVSDK